MKNPDNLQSSYVTRHKSLITREDRERLHKHKGAVLWFTGLSASGKSTISHLVEEKLHNMGCSTYVFDGDNVRHGLCGDLSFFEKDRAENIQRDPKDIYAKALKGEIKDFTGTPESPTIVIKADQEDFEGAAQRVVGYMLGTLALIALFLFTYWLKCQMDLNLDKSISLHRYCPFKCLQKICSGCQQTLHSDI